VIDAIEHITLTSGARNMSPRSAVADAVVSHIRAALAGDGDIGQSWRAVAADPRGRPRL
jgi:hypothetical protein